MHILASYMYAYLSACMCQLGCYWLVFCGIGYWRPYENLSRNSKFCKKIRHVSGTSHKDL